MAKCRVTFTSTPQDQSVHIEELDNPNNLLYAAEDERIAPVFHLAWRNFIRDNAVNALDIHFGRAMSRARRNRVLRAAWSLIRLILNQERK